MIAQLLVGAELFFPDRFAPLLKPVRPDLKITMVPGIGHIGMTVTPEGIAAVRNVTFLTWRGSAYRGLPHAVTRHAASANVSNN
jgi:hypothetical protein